MVEGLDALAALSVPPILPDETLPSGSVRVAVGPDVSLRFDVALFYDQNGAPLHGDAADVMPLVNAAREAPGGQLTSRPFYRAGVRIFVSTAYLGLDLSTSGYLPLVWETMTFVDGGTALGLGIVGPWRYATRAAAHAGHARIVTAIREQQRARRVAQATTPPRRSGRS
jgi:hypothetical protein